MNIGDEGGRLYGHEHFGELECGVPGLCREASIVGAEDAAAGVPEERPIAECDWLKEIVPLREAGRGCGDYFIVCLENVSLTVALSRSRRTMAGFCT